MRFTTFVIFCEAVAFLAIVWLWVASEMWGHPQGVGEFGDLFGGLTAIFSGLAFAGLLATILLQSEEIELQRKELQLSRDEFHLQRFENTFFGLVRLFNDHVASLSLRYSGDQESRGREVLEHFAREIDDQFSRAAGSANDRSFWEVAREDVTLAKQLRGYVEKYNGIFESDLGPYFRLLYNIIRHIEYSTLEDSQKLRYSKIARAYLGSAEIKLLMFNCATDLGKNFKPWVEKHGLLKHIHLRAARSNPDLFRTYSESAFGDRYHELFALLNRESDSPIGQA